MKKVFVGIDFSKLTFDAVVLFDVESNVFTHQVFDNTPDGCALFVKWVKSQINANKKILINNLLFIKKHS